MPFERTFSSATSVTSGVESPGPSISVRGFRTRSIHESFSPNLSSSRRLSVASQSTVAVGRRGDALLSPTRAIKRSFGRQQERQRALESIREIATHKPEDVNLIGLQPAQEGSIEALFIHYNVREVRAVENRANKEAAAKREELRTMVGERYRDLLGAADSIVRMRASSEALIQDLNSVRSGCSRRQLTQRAEKQASSTHHRHKSMYAPPEEMTSYTVATLIKLLLDLPDHIWHAIEKQDYLQAARLEGLSRVVYQELISYSDAAEDEQAAQPNGLLNGFHHQESTDILSAFPLIERQFESIQGMNEQISKRAHASLSKWDVSAMAVTESLASILLLDSLGIDEVLDEMLVQRLTTLRRLTASNDSSPVDDTTNRLTRIISITLNTLQHAETIFRHEDGTLCTMIAQLQQIDNQIPSDNAVAIPSILQTLPSTHNLTRYLPQSIAEFVPYFDGSTDSGSFGTTKLDAKLSAWFASALDAAQAGSSLIWQATDSTAKLHQLHELCRSLCLEPNSTYGQTLFDLLQSALLQRVETLHSNALDAMQDNCMTDLTAALPKIRHNDQDVNQAAFIFAESVQEAPSNFLVQSKSPKEEPFVNYSKLLNQRLEGQTPLLRGCLQPPTAAINAILQDSEAWLEADTLPRIKQALADAFVDAVKAFRFSLADLADQTDSVDRKMFLARFASKLARGNGPFSALLVKLPECNAMDLLRRSSGELIDKTFQAWKARALEDASTARNLPGDPSLSNDTSSDSQTKFSLLSRPSLSVHRMLSSIVDSLESLHEDLAIDRTVAARQLCAQLQQDASDGETPQGHFDQALLRYLMGVPSIGQQPDLDEAVSQYSASAYNLLAVFFPDYVAQAATSSIKQSSTSATPSAPKLAPRFGLLPVPPLRR